MNGYADRSHEPSVTQYWGGAAKGRATASILAWSLMGTYAAATVAICLFLGSRNEAAPPPLIAAAEAQSPPAPTDGHRNRYELIDPVWHDGDTCTARIALGWKVSIGPEPIRAANYDAWESGRTRQTVVVTDEEIVKGKAAAEYARTLKSSGTLYLIPKRGGQRDAYGRVLGDMWLRTTDGTWTDLGRDMEQKGHTRR